ncbi:hypothetical protein, conserved [Eimeria necatrix]|uniref:Uncharacterized protein n=1 Tax=Eimeria necatrix TaxID=51315 RepID=U6MZH2_9EIME|nr:hypothetical protein, conserved [Eimeria necatrix]CDJ67065.1 hypothetical protein, conserved [Eimeria necatrix]
MRPDAATSISSPLTGLSEIGRETARGHTKRRNDRASRQVARPLQVSRALILLIVACCHDWLWCQRHPTDPSKGTKNSSSAVYSWAAEASTVFDGRFLGRKIATEALRQSPVPRTPEKQPMNDDDFLEDEEPMEIWGDIDDRRMILSAAPCPCAAALRQAFNAALRILVDRGVRNQLLLKYRLPLSFAVELQGASPAWPKLSDLYEHDLLREVLERRVLRVATVAGGASQDPATSSFNSSFLREIVDEIDSHYSEIEGLSESTGRRGSLPIQIEYVYKASTAVVLQALDAGQAHMTDINMVLSHNPFNGITMTSRYSRSDQVMTQSTIVIVKSDTNIASLRALRDSIFLSYDQEGRTVVVDSTWNHQSLARVLPPFTIYELLSDGAPGSHLIDVLMDEEALAATAQVPLPWIHYGLRQFVAGATYATGALFLMDKHGSKCPTAASGKRNPVRPAAPDKPGEDPALSSLRRELTKKSLGFQRSQQFYVGSRKSSWEGVYGADTPGGPTDGEDSYPATPGPWSTEPSTPVGEMELFDSLRGDAGEPLASGRRYLRTRALHDSYNAALVQLVHNSVLDNLIEDLQEINIVPFFDCGGTVPGSVARSFPPAHRIPPDDALMDILRTGVVLVGMPMGSKESISSPEVLYAQRAMTEVVAAIGAEYRVTLQTRFIRFPSAQHVLRALHKGLIHLADARILFEYISPHARLGFRVRPTCALGASRLWMMTQNKDGMTSLEGLHQTLEKIPDVNDRRIGVLDQYLQSTVASVLPPGVLVVELAVEEAAEALLSRSVVAVFGMATQQRRLLRSLLNVERRPTDQDNHAWEKMPQVATFDSRNELRWGSPIHTPGSGSFPDAFPDRSRLPSDRFTPGGPDWTPEDGPGFPWHVAAPLQYTKDIYQELMKAEGLPLETNEAPQQNTPSWIDIDTGVTAVMHSFLAASLRSPRTSG